MDTKTVVLTALFFGVLIGIDLTHAWRNRNQVTTTKTATKQVLLYISIAVIFGLLMRNWTSVSAQESYFASWITEYSLSLDNLFVFILLFRKLRIDQEKQEIALFFGISVSLVLRAACLIAGVALLHKFAFINFFFALILGYTAFHLMREGAEEEEWEENNLLKKLRSKGIHGFALALYAIALTDLMFAFDSIPAVLGVTNDIYVILTSNFMALMGLRQLYFLVERLVHRLYYLTAGISIILFFISFKLFCAALHAYDINKIANVGVPEIETHQSLIFILGTLIISTILSLMKKEKA